MGTTERFGHVRGRLHENAARRERERERPSQMIPASWDWQKKAKIAQAGLKSFCFCSAPCARECHRAHFFISRFHPGDQWFNIILC
jgi:hypothetical protein